MSGEEIMDAAVDTPSSDTGAAKRKRSPSVSHIGPPAKKAQVNYSINYLARQSQEDLPLVTKDDNLPNILHLLSTYGSVLDRHESLASNLGARPLGPNLIKRFERCFEQPPKVVASHHKGAASDPETSPHQITWLEVIEFARSHPGQFTLSTFSEGKRVCQFYYPQKQLRVQISEEDFLFVNSGRCQDLIPPLPIWEDEEKEVCTCDVLEVKLKELTNAADMIAARTRQLSHRLKGRRAAILERRADGGSGTPAKASAPQTTTVPPSSSGTGFTAVNTGKTNDEATLGSNAANRADLLRLFESLPHNQTSNRTQSRHSVSDGTQPTAKPAEVARDTGGRGDSSSLSPPPAHLDTLSYYISDESRPQQGNPYHRATSSGGNASGQTPLKHNFSRPLPPALESSQPFRPLCQAHMDGLPRGQRVLPPCDRCRRLRMDCVKNLTSCAGCTKKHARCHWRDVSREELGALDHLMESTYAGSMYSPINDTIHVNGYANGGSEAAPSDLGDHQDESDDDDSNPLEDLEALGEKEEAAERMREDEEGLRSAKELSRQGFEESVRSSLVTGIEGAEGESPLVEQSTTPFNVVPEDEQMHHVYEDVRDPHEQDEQKVSVEAQDQTSRNGVRTTEAAAPAQYDIPSASGGFRAVNEAPTAPAPTPSWQTV